MNNYKFQRDENQKIEQDSADMIKRNENKIKNNSKLNKFNFKSA